MNNFRFLTATFASIIAFVSSVFTPIAQATCVPYVPTVACSGVPWASEINNANNAVIYLGGVTVQSTKTSGVNILCRIEGITKTNLSDSDRMLCLGGTQKLANENLGIVSTHYGPTANDVASAIGCTYLTRVAKVSNYQIISKDVPLSLICWTDVVGISNTYNLYVGTDGKWTCTKSAS